MERVVAERGCGLLPVSPGGGLPGPGLPALGQAPRTAHTERPQGRLPRQPLHGRPRHLQGRHPPQVWGHRLLQGVLRDSIVRVIPAPQGASVMKMLEGILGQETLIKVTRRVMSSC